MQVHWFNGSVVKTTTRCVTQPQSILAKITRYLFAGIIAKKTLSGYLVAIVEVMRSYSFVYLTNHMIVFP